MKAIVEYIQKKHIQKASKEEIMDELYDIDSIYTFDDDHNSPISILDADLVNGKDLSFIRYNDVTAHEFSGEVSNSNRLIKNVTLLIDLLYNETTCLFAYKSFLNTIFTNLSYSGTKSAKMLDDALTKNNIKITSYHSIGAKAKSVMCKQDSGYNTLAVFTSTHELRVILDCIKNVFKL